jgi:hypothetical protein
MKYEDIRNKTNPSSQPKVGEYSNMDFNAIQLNNISEVKHYSVRWSL